MNTELQQQTRTPNCLAAVAAIALSTPLLLLLFGINVSNYISFSLMCFVGVHVASLACSIHSDAIFTFCRIERSRSERMSGERNRVRK